MSTTSNNFRRGFWRLADPKISLASFASLWLGHCFAAAAAPLHWGWVAVTVLGIFAIEVAKNASGEIVDYRSGTDLNIQDQDRSPFSGGKRVMVDGLLTETQTRRLARWFYTLGIVCGLGIVVFREWRVLPLGLLGVALAWFYHSRPLSLSYRGFGEIAVAIAYGPLVACGSYLVQTGDLSSQLLMVACALGLLIAAFLWVNEFPDYRADLAANKRNLVVRLGRQRASRLFPLLILAALALLLLGATRWPDSLGLLWGLLAFIPALRAIILLWRNPEDTPRLIAAQVASLFSFVLFALLLGLARLL